MATGLGRARLAIPRVNTDPRPPKLGQAQAIRSRIGLGKGRPAPGPGIAPAKPVSTTTAQPTNTVAASTPGSTAAAATAAPAAPSPPPSNDLFAIPSYTPGQGEADPRDAAYWSNLAKLRFQDQQEYAKNLASESQGNAAYAFAKQEAIRNRAIQERQLGENAIKGNLSASGWLNRTQGEQETTYTSQRAAADLSHEQELHAFQAARNALQEGFGIEAASLLAEAAGRLSAREEQEAAKGAPEAGGEASASGPSGSAPTGGAAGKFPFYPGPNQLPGGKLGTGQPARGNPKKAALANRRKAR
jgi:hypothetical protein